MKILFTFVLLIAVYLCDAQSDTVVKAKQDTSVSKLIKKDSILPVPVVLKDTGYVKIILTEINYSKKGWLFAGLYNAGSFLKKEPMRKYAAEINGSQMVFRFDSVPKGYYAIAAIQDVNRNEKLDVNNIGIPSEGFAFSNNVVGSFGPPVFVDCRFYFNGRSKIMTMKMKYMLNNK